VEGKLVVRHVVGEEIPKAFKLSNGAVTWVNPFPARKACGTSWGNLKKKEEKDPLSRLPLFL